MAKSPKKPSAKPRVSKPNVGAKTIKAVAPIPPSASKPRDNTKQAKVIALLRRPDGATVADLAKATGWQQHTVRGAISGALKKKLRLKIISEKAKNGERVYRIDD
jgi:hypothetical protein